PRPASRRAGRVRHGSWPRALPRSAAAPARYRYSCCVNLPRCAPRAGRKPLTVGLPGKTPQWFVWRAHALRPRSDPHGRADQHSDTDDPGDHAFRSGAETAEPVTTGRVVAVRHRLHVGHDVPLLLGGELSVGELRHVLRTALHRGVNLFLGGGCELRRELTRRQRTTLPSSGGPTPHRARGWTPAAQHRFPWDAQDHHRWPGCRRPARRSPRATTAAAYAAPALPDAPSASGHWRSGSTPTPRRPRSSSARGPPRLGGSRRGS